MSILTVQVNCTGGLSASKLAAAAQRDFAGISISRMVGELADRSATLDSHTGTQRQTLQHASAKCVAEECIGNVVTVSVQRANSKLIAQQIQRAASEIKQ